MTALNSHIESFLREHKCALPDIGLLQPADPILNAAGEDIRRRIFITADQRGASLCLRPEFTIPVCLEHLESGRDRKRYGYVGKVFRQRADEPAEFVQAGIEDIGAKNVIAADAKCLREAVELLKSLGRNKLAVTIGDQAIFEAVLKSLGLPKAWRERLGRAFGDGERLKADLDRLSGKTAKALANLSAEMLEAVNAKDRKTLVELVEKELDKAGLTSQGGRSADEIAARLMEKAQLAQTVLSPEKREILESFLSLDLPLANANRKLWAFARRSHIPLGDALEAFHKRIQAIDRLELENVSIRYRTGFGRQLDYYTGFVFEIRAPGNASGKLSQKPLAGGGRYDRLLGVLGAKHKIPAIGFAVYVDRVGAKIPAPAGAAKTGMAKPGTAKPRQARGEVA